MIVVHGDDFFRVGSLVAPQSVNHLLRSYMEVKRAPYIGAREHGGETDTDEYPKLLIEICE